MTINKSCFYLIIILAKCLIMDLANGDGCKSDLLNSISKILKGQQSSYNFSHITMLSPGRRDGGSCITLTLEIACFMPPGKNFSICQISIQSLVVVQKNKVSTLETFVKSDPS